MSSFAAYGEARDAGNRYALELADWLQGSGVSAAVVHPRSGFGSGGNAVMKFAMKRMQPIIYNLESWTDSSEQAAQTSLHVLLSDEAPNHSGVYFSQHSILYCDKQCNKGGWPMESPNPIDLEKARRLVAISRDIVDLNNATITGNAA